jgi:thiol-disulfide isomerase/thioredoxin
MPGIRPATLLTIVAFIAGISAIFAYRYVNGAGGSAPGILGGKRLDYTLVDIEGKPRQLREWDGKVVLVNFWATWCPPCRTEIPDFVAMQEKYGGKGVQFVGIALDNNENIAEFLRTEPVNYPILLDREDKSLSFDYGNTSGVLPYTVVVDRDGTVRATRQGRFHRVEVEATIRDLL